MGTDGNVPVIFIPDCRQCFRTFRPAQVQEEFELLGQLIPAAYAANNALFAFYNYLYYICDVFITVSPEDFHFFRLFIFPAIGRRDSIL